MKQIPFFQACLIVALSLVPSVALSNDSKTLAINDVDGRQVSVDRNAIQATLAKSIREELSAQNIVAADILVNGDGSLITLLEPRYKQGDKKIAIMFARHQADLQDLLCHQIGYKESVEQVDSDSWRDAEFIENGLVQFIAKNSVSFSGHRLQDGVLYGFKNFVTRATCRR